MIDLHTLWIPSGLPDLAARSGNSRWPPNLRYLVGTLGAGHFCFGTDYPLPVHANPADSIVDSLDRAEAALVREGTASALLSLQ
jgi:hypothetical protein